MLGTKRRIWFRLGLCAALVSGLVAAGGPAALADCAETVWADVYDVTLEAERDTYRPGDTARLHATVVHRQTGMPVEDARFVAYITNLKKALILGYGMTDADGKAEVGLKLKKGSVRGGPVNVRGIAYKESVDATCARLVEYGEKRLKNAFVIKR